MTRTIEIQTVANAAKVNVPDLIIKELKILCNAAERINPVNR